MSSKDFDGGEHAEVLQKAFDDEDWHTENFVIRGSNAGLFGMDHLDSPEGWDVLKDQCLSDLTRLRDKFDSAPTRPSNSNEAVEVLKDLDEISDTLCRVLDPAELCRCTHASPRWVGAAEQAHAHLSPIIHSLNNDSNIFEASERLCDPHVVGGAFDEEAEYVAKSLLKEFQEAGARLPRHVQSASQVLQSRIDQLAYAFQKGGSVTNAKQVGVRLDVLKQLLDARYQLARTLGFPSYAHMKLQSQMLQDPSEVVQFLLQAGEAVAPQAMEEAELLREEASAMGKDGSEPLHRLKRVVQQRLFPTPSGHSHYFSLGTCMRGLSNVLRSLYGVSLRVVPQGDGECVAPGVRKLMVLDEAQDAALGHVYVDLFRRSGKADLFANFMIRCGHVARDGERVLPVQAVVGQLPRPAPSHAPLLSIDDYTTIFHEFGHTMHSMLSGSRFQHASGIRGAMDFIECPSTLMEFFALDPRVMSLVARHHVDGSSLPMDHVHRIIGGRRLFGAVNLQSAVAKALADQTCHSHSPPQDPLGQVQRAFHRHAPHSPSPSDAWLANFGHMAGYGATYYSYLWCKHVCSNVWYKVFDQDPFSRDAGERFRHTVLKHGASKDPKRMLQEFLRGPLETKHLSRHVSLHDE